MELWKKVSGKRKDTIEHYLKTFGKRSFQMSPFNDVDSLLLCQLSYLKFDGMVPGIRGSRSSVTLRSLREKTERENLFHEIIFERENRKLFAWMSASRRFGSLRLNGYINVVEKKREVQFSAVTFLLEDGTVFVAFRGTDETFVGWKEDFNMAFLCPVPGQTLAVKYLNAAARRFDGDFYVGGHSKGGNLAIYGAMHCAAKVRRRILRIYDLDGPGFRPEILRSARYVAVADRVIKYLPSFSVVGMLFAGDDRYHVVKARGIGPIQHDPFRWRVRNGSFLLKGRLDPTIRHTDRALNRLLLSMSEEQCRGMVETVYRAIAETKTENVIEFAADWKHNVGVFFRALARIKADTAGEFRTPSAPTEKWTTRVPPTA